MDNNTYPQLSRGEAVKHCKQWGEAIRKDGIDLLVNDYSAAVALADALSYPLEMQTWINTETEPTLDEVSTYAVLVGNDPTNRTTWETLLKLIEALE